MAIWQDEKVYTGSISARVGYRLEFGGLLGDFINNACTITSGDTGNCTFTIKYVGDNKMLIPILVSPNDIVIDSDNEDEYLTPYWKNESTGNITNLPTTKREFFEGRVQKNGVWYQQLLTYTVLHPENCEYDTNADPSEITFNGIRHSFGVPVQGSGDFSSPSDLTIRPSFGSEILINRFKITAEGVNTNNYYSISKDNLVCRLTTQERVNINGTVYSKNALFYIDVILDENITLPAKVWDPKRLFGISVSAPVYDTAHYIKKINIQYSAPSLGASLPFSLGVFTNYLWYNESYTYQQQMKRANSYEHYYQSLSTTAGTTSSLEVEFPGYLDTLAFIDGDTSSYPVLVSAVYDATSTADKALLVCDLREAGTTDTLFHTIVKDDITINTWDYNYNYDFSNYSLVATTEGTYQDKYGSFLFDKGKSSFDVTYIVNRIPLYKSLSGYDSYGRNRVITYNILFNSYLKLEDSEIIFNFPLVTWSPESVSQNFITNASLPWNNKVFSSAIPANRDTVDVYGGLNSQITRDGQILSEKSLIYEKKVNSNTNYIYHWAPVELISAQTERYKLSGGSYVRDDTAGTYLGTKVDYTLHPIDGSNMIRVHKITYSLEDDTQAVSYDFADNVYNYHSPFDIEKSWKVTVELSDDLQQTIRYVYSVAAGRTFLDFLAGGTGMAIGKVAESSGLEIALNTTFGHDPANPITVDFTNANVIGVGSSSAAFVSGTDTLLNNYMLFGSKLPNNYVELKGVMEAVASSSSRARTGYIDLTDYLDFNNYFDNFEQEMKVWGGVAAYASSGVYYNTFLRGGMTKIYFIKDSSDSNKAQFDISFSSISNVSSGDIVQVSFDILLIPTSI